MRKDEWFLLREEREVRQSYYNDGYTSRRFGQVCALVYPVRKDRHCLVSEQELNTSNRV